MPLPKRSIDPLHVARSVYQQGDIRFVELETVTNTTLTNIIRQLSSLSKNAEDIFGELARDVSSIGERANSLQARIDRLAIKVTQLDSSVEEMPLTDITRKKAFKSAKIFDQQIFSRSTMPSLMLETYSQCDKPPPLDKLNAYRDDGKDGLKFYTDPNYFFELWRQEMLKDTERVMHDKGKKLHRPKDGINGLAGASRNHKKRVRAPHNTREKQKQIAIGQGEMIMPNNIGYRNPNKVISEDTVAGVDLYNNKPLRPKSIEIKRNYQEKTDGSSTPQIIANSLTKTGPHFLSAYESSNGVDLIPQSNIQLHQQQFYDESNYQQSHNIYVQPGQGITSSDIVYGPGTPSRTKSRPSHPPPAPPSNGSSCGTPSASCANTPTRGRSMSSSRDILPPPPPIPEGMMNATSPSQVLAALNNSNNKLLTRTNSSSRSDSAHTVHDSNALVMSQLNNTLNTFNTVNISNISLQGNDLPPPPMTVEQHSPKIPPTAPPPPPPPPPTNKIDFVLEKVSEMQNSLYNGERQLGKTSSASVTGSLQHIVAPKKLLLPFHESRNDLMKAIRDGITLRKVEKSEQKEIERNTAFHDVASILARRVAIELSESEESDSDEDSEGWMESHETFA